MKQEIIKAKNNLKEYYQNQLDSLLKEKVDEFQRELQNGQNLLDREFRYREKQLEEKFASELRKMHERLAKFVFILLSFLMAIVYE